MRISGTIQDSIVDGPGLRFVVFTQGCPHGCPGCHNPQTHDPAGGREPSPEEIIQEMLSNPLTDGLTLSGGEPFMQPADCLRIAEAAKSAGLNVWCYTGYTYEALQRIAEGDPDTDALLRSLDVLIDGPFILEERSFSTKWRGSPNQRLINVPETLAKGNIVLLED